MPNDTSLLELDMEAQLWVRHSLEVMCHCASSLSDGRVSLLN